MSTELQLLSTAALLVACLHTLTGPDHYLPFIVLSKSRGWSFFKTLLWTIGCGCGHVWSSVLLGLGGAALGWNLSKISGLEQIRGGLAGWLLLCFGLVYALWGLFRAYNKKNHKHFDTYEDGSMYVYEHQHGKAVARTERHKVTPWVLFLIFLLGPCEPMIPLLFFPAAQHSWSSLLWLILIYTFFTLLTMVGMVALGFYSISFFKTDFLEKHLHTLGGVTLIFCGAGMVFMGW